MVHKEIKGGLIGFKACDSSNDLSSPSVLRQVFSLLMRIVHISINLFLLYNFFLFSLMMSSVHDTGHPVKNDLKNFAHIIFHNATTGSGVSRSWHRPCRAHAVCEQQVYGHAPACAGFEAAGRVCNIQALLCNIKTLKPLKPVFFEQKQMG